MLSRTHSAFGRAFVAALALTAVVLPTTVRAEVSGSYTCPVLHNSIDKVTKNTPSSDYKGVRYYFSCEACKPQFDKSTDKYLDGLDGRIKATQEKAAARPEQGSNL